MTDETSAEATQPSPRSPPSASHLRWTLAALAAAALVAVIVWVTHDAEADTFAGLTDFAQVNAHGNVHDPAIRQLLSRFAREAPAPQLDLAALEQLQPFPDTTADEEQGLSLEEAAAQWDFSLAILEHPPQAFVPPLVYLIASLPEHPPEVAVVIYRFAGGTLALIVDSSEEHSAHPVAPPPDWDSVAFEQDGSTITLVSQSLKPELLERLKSGVVAFASVGGFGEPSEE